MNPILNFFRRAETEVKAKVETVVHKEQPMLSHEFQAILDKVRVLQDSLAEALKHNTIITELKDAAEKDLFAARQEIAQLRQEASTGLNTLKTTLGLIPAASTLQAAPQTAPQAIPQDTLQDITATNVTLVNTVAGINIPEAAAPALVQGNAYIDAVARETIAIPAAAQVQLAPEVTAAVPS